MTDKRWIVTLYYRSGSGDIDVQLEAEELDEVADFVERGPDWHSLIRGEFCLNPKRSISGDLTLEELT
jgi:hypothetical protein